MDRLQTSAHALQRAQHHQHVLGFLSEHHGSAIECQQVADIELADELYAHLAAVHLKIHAFEVAFQDTGAEIGHRAGRVGLHLCLAVLHHHHAVLVVGIRDGKGRLRQSVEEGFLRVAVVFHGLMVVHVVACQVGEYASCKFQSANTFLMDGMT